MIGIFNRLANKIKYSFEGLSDDMPEIEWVKAVHSYSTVAFLAPKSLDTALKFVGDDIIMKAEDGRFFARKKWDEKPVWHGVVRGESQIFRSPYLDSILEKAFNDGMQTQPSAFDIQRQTLGPNTARYFLILNGTDEQVANLDKTHPTAPTGFNDYHTPEDFDESAPYFAAFLRKRGYEPFRLKPVNAATMESSPPPQPK